METLILLVIYFCTFAHHELSLLLIIRKQINTAAASDLNSAELLQDVADGVSDVKMMHDDISVGMKDLNIFVSDSMTQVTSLMVVMVCCTGCVFLTSC